MKRLIILIVFLTCIKAFSQETAKQGAVLYIVDNVPIIDDPKEDDVQLQQTDVELVIVITNKAQIEKSGFKNVDKILDIKTKAYTNRPDSIKQIPTTKLMTRKGDIWYAKDSDTPFSGRFIDYYLNGTK